MAQLPRSFPREMGDLLFEKIDGGIDHVAYHHPQSLSNLSFRDALEMYCYRNKLHIPLNRASLFYMILGYLSTLPYTKQFSRFGIKNMFLATDGQTIKAVVQYSHTAVGIKSQGEDYEVFAIHTNPVTPKRRFYAKDRDMVQELVKEVHPSFKKKKLKAAFKKVQHITIKKPETGSMYIILTDDGAKSFLAHGASPLVVGAELLPIIKMIGPISYSFMMLKVPPSYFDFKQLIGQIQNIFHKAASANRLQSTPDNFLSFLQGALEFNYKLNDELRIRPYFDLFDNSYRKLFLQKHDGQGWISSEAPIVIIASRFADDLNRDQDGSLPSDFDARIVTMKEMIQFCLLENGYILQRRFETPIAIRKSLVEQFLNLLESGNQFISLREVIEPVIQMMDLDSEFFFARQSQPGENFLPKYILGQLMAYAGTIPVETFAFSYNQQSETLVTFLIRRTGSADGVAIHVLEDRGSRAVFAFPDYRIVGVTGKILNLHLDCRSVNSMPGYTMSGLSRLPLKSIYADSTYYSYMSSSFHAQGVFRKIDQQLVNKDVYVSSAGRGNLLSLIHEKSIKAGLRSETSFELETLTKSFCLAKSELRTFLPYPTADPTIVGIHSIANLPVVLMKCGVDVTANQLMDDLRATFMGDNKLLKKKLVIIKVMSVSSNGMHTLNDYQEEVFFNDMCMNHPSLTHFRLEKNDFWKSTRYQEEKLEEGSVQYKMTKEMISQEEISQKYTIFRKIIEQHMGAVESFSSALMHATIAKNIVGAIVDGNYEEVAINIGFLTGSAGLGYAANYAALKGANLVAEGSEFLRSSLKLAAPFLARVSSAFVAYDLYKQLEAYNKGNKDALVGVVSDSVVLTIDVASVVVESLGALDLIGSSLSGPIGAAFSPVIFIGADIYQAAKTVDSINSQMKLTAHEKLEESLLAFLQAGPDQYILDLMEAEQLNNEVRKRSMTVLYDMPQFQIYGSPSLVRCEPQQSLNICTSGVKEVENNEANFTQLRKFYSRTWPNTSNNFRAICANARQMESQENPKLGNNVELWLSQETSSSGNDRMALKCNNFEVIFDKSMRDGNKAFLKAASGNDSIVGFLERSNVISFTSGNKYFIGGNRPDTFILHGEEIAMGFIDGGDGLDTLDFSKYAKSELPIKFYNGYKTAHFLVVRGTNHKLDIHNVENFIGRPDAQDTMLTNCNTTFLNLQGGTEQLPDSISITESKNRLCNYNLTIELYHNTIVWNEACSGTFFYALNKNSRSGTVKMQNFCKSDQSAEGIVKTNLPLRAVSKMHIIVDGGDQTRLEIQFENGIILSVIDFNLEQTHFLFEDFKLEVKISDVAVHRNVSLIKNPDNVMQSLSVLHYLNAVPIVEGENNQNEIEMKMSTAQEKVEESPLAFVHVSPDQYILDLIEGKQLNKRSMAVLNDMPQLKIYGSPSLVRCKPQKSLNICTSGVKEVENNIVNFTQLWKFHSRTWPGTSNSFRVICANASLMENQESPRLGRSVELWLSEEKSFSGNHRMALKCNNFEAIFDTSMRHGNNALLKAASGNDTIVGFRERSNVISFTSGIKYLIGGNRPDTFIMHGEEIAMGFIDGGDGLDTLDFSKYARSDLPIQLYNGYKTAHLLTVSGTNYRLDIDSVENFIGRPDAQDTIFTNCNTTFLNLQGGTEQLPDSISITASKTRFCDYNLAVELYHSTNVWNDVCSGTFFYALNKNSKSGNVKMQNFCESNQSAESIVKTNLPLRAVSKMQRIVDDDNHTRLEFQFENGIILFVVDFNFERTHFLFEDFSVKVENSGIVGYRKVPVIENPYDLMQSLSELYHLNAVLIVEDENNQTKITTGHGRLIANAKNPEQYMVNGNVLSNDLRFEHSILVSGKSTENTFKIVTKCITDSQVSSCRPIIVSIFLEKNKTSGYKDLIDMSDAYPAMRTECTLKVTAQLVYKTMLSIELWMINQKFNKNQLGTVTVHNIDPEHLEKQLTVFLNVPFFFHVESDSVTLKPVSLSFSGETKLIILQTSDVVDFMPVKISKSVGHFLTVLKSKDTHVILTNMMDPDIKNKPGDLLTICMANYYKSEGNARLFNTLSLEFSDRAIINLGDFMIEKRGDIIDFDVFMDIVQRLNML